jgi:hypothetical protein
LGEDLKAMVETHNGSAADSVTFDELVRWMKGEVGGKYPLTSFRDGLKQEFANKAWTKEVLHLRLVELKQIEARVSNTLALYMEAHREYLIATWRAFSPEQEALLDEDEEDSNLETKQHREREASLEAQFAEWREEEYAKLEVWVHPNNFADLLAKAEAEAKAEEEEFKATVKQGQDRGRPMKFAEIFSAKTSSLMGRVNEVRKEMEEKGSAKMRELREELIEPRGAAPSQGKGLRVSVEKLRFQKEDVAGCPHPC